MLAYAFLVKFGMAAIAAVATFLIVVTVNAVSSAMNKVAESNESKKNAGCQECA